VFHNPVDALTGAISMAWLRQVTVGNIVWWCVDDTLQGKLAFPDESLEIIKSLEIEYGSTCQMGLVMV